MNLEQRKTDLINWIMNLDNESILHSVEALKMHATQDIPDRILSLLHLSNKAAHQDLTEHKSAKDIVNG